jgi:hypothetical protein
MIVDWINGRANITISLSICGNVRFAQSNSPGFRNSKTSEDMFEKGSAVSI